MLNQREETEYRALKVLSVSRDSLGSGTLRDDLVKYGTRISEATAGRLLRELDGRGYTEKVSFRGRRLTERGRARLMELERERERANFGSELLRTLRAKGKSELIEVLVARRAIERETARLAAMNATEREIAEMESIIARHRRATESGGSGSDEDVKFHHLIAAAARNRVLMAASSLVRQDGQLAPILTYIRRQVKSRVVDDHVKIYEAIASRDPAAAEAAMVEHMENLIRDVERYWMEHERSG
ncbi:MAG: FCD domain-containing protein [Firmicutes bacterium]|jgi:GntR family L-lactate dehydrogenase operon transcriptional regulator|nr:FCD domain-containing protein [Bacillota bacterium]